MVGRYSGISVYRLSGYCPQKKTRCIFTNRISNTIFALDIRRSLHLYLPLLPQCSLCGIDDRLHLHAVQKTLNRQKFLHPPGGLCNACFCVVFNLLSFTCRNSGQHGLRGHLLKMVRQLGAGVELKSHFGFSTSQTSVSRSQSSSQPALPDHPLSQAAGYFSLTYRTDTLLYNQKQGSAVFLLFDHRFHTDVR